MTENKIGYFNPDLAEQREKERKAKKTDRSTKPIPPYYPVLDTEKEKYRKRKEESEKL